MRYVNLIFAAQFVDAERAADRDVKPVGRLAFEGAGLVAKADAANLCLGIFQREINVTGLRGAAIGNFALDPDVGEAAFEEIADFAGEFADFPDAPLGD
jgi:hypothetical protein